MKFGSFPSLLDGLGLKQLLISSLSVKIAFFFPFLSEDSLEREESLPGHSCEQHE